MLCNRKLDKNFMSTSDINEYTFMKSLTILPFVEQIWLFGSRARGDNAERADIDIAICCPEATEEDWHRILEIIDTADTLLKIDCVRFDRLEDNDKLKQNIIKFKKVLYCKGARLVETVFWKDYFDSLGQAIIKFGEVIRHKDVEKNDYMQDASIQRFEFVIELFWKVLKKILSYEKVDSTTPRDVLSKSFQFKLIDNEKVWLNMLDDRNNTTHVYKQEDAKRVFESIKTYLPVFEKTYSALKIKYKL